MKHWIFALVVVLSLARAADAQQLPQVSEAERLIQQAQTLLFEAMRQLNPPPTCEPESVEAPINTDWLRDAGHDPTKFYFSGTGSAYWVVPIVVHCPLLVTSNEPWLHVLGQEIIGPDRIGVQLQTDTNDGAERAGTYHFGSYEYQVQQERK